MQVMLLLVQLSGRYKMLLVGPGSDGSVLLSRMVQVSRRGLLLLLLRLLSTQVTD